MQFLFLLLFNIFLGAVLYLVISLKLERSASEFRERRFRKEMDEVIKEFNITAERNITLLEGKIRVLKMLLEKTGDHRSLNVILEQEGVDAVSEPVPEKDAGVRETGLESPGSGSRLTGDETKERNNAASLIKKGLLILFDRIISISLWKKGYPADQGEIPADVGGFGHGIAPEQVPREDVPYESNTLIEKDLGAVKCGGTEKPEKPERKKLMTENDILEIVSTVEDRYQLVSLLSERGCDIDDISRYSGMPAGEVRLVLNLNREANESRW
ncbi:MAG: hypothetical protein JXA07_13675 [Spirochaetes bacterium]|nr:hypothetical protein [Spirochaetota bacterium]